MQGIDSTGALAAYLKRQGGGARILGPPGATRQAIATAEPDALADLLDTIRALAQQHGWMSEYTYNAQGPDTGLHVTLVREVVLMAEVHREGETLTPSQQRWLAALERTGQVETYAWTPTDVPQIEARLARTHDATGT